MTATYDDLLDEIQCGESVLLSAARVGESQVMRITVQRGEGAIWEAFDYYTAQARLATPHSLLQLQYAYDHGFYFDVDAFDRERLYRWITFLEGVDFADKAMQQAQQVLREARAS